MPQVYLDRLRYSGLAAFLGGWLVILAAISRNPWFLFTENAFSDLGNPVANDPWVFNFGMMLNGLLIIVYGFYLFHVSFNKTSSVGAGFMMITGIFLVLIGVFPEGSQNHYMVSVWFFTQGALTVFTWGLALYRTRWSWDGVIFLVLSIGGSVAGFLIPWPSIAVVEAWGIIIMDIWVAMMTRITPGFND